MSLDDAAQPEVPAADAQLDFTVEPRTASSSTAVTSLVVLLLALAGVLLR